MWLAVGQSWLPSQTLHLLSLHPIRPAPLNAPHQAGLPERDGLCPRGQVSSELNASRPSGCTAHSTAPHRFRRKMTAPPATRGPPPGRKPGQPFERDSAGHCRRSWARPQGIDGRAPLRPPREGMQTLLRSLGRLAMRRGLPEGQPSQGWTVDTHRFLCARWPCS